MNAALKLMAACAWLSLAGCAAPDVRSGAAGANPIAALRTGNGLEGQAGAEAGNHAQSAGAYYETGRRFQRAGKIALAVQAWRQALAIEPAHAEAGNALAVLSAQQAEYPQAIALFRRQIDNSPQSGYLYNNLGYTYLLSGDIKAALASLEKATALAPDNARAWNNLATVLERLGDTKRADRARENVAELLAQQSQPLNAEISQLGSLKMGWRAGNAHSVNESGALAVSDKRQMSAEE